MTSSRDIVHPATKNCASFRRFTVDIDRRLLQEGHPILVTIDCKPGAGQQVQDALAPREFVDHVFRSADDRLICKLSEGA